MVQAQRLHLEREDSNIIENAHIFPEDFEQVKYISIHAPHTVQVGLSSVVSRIIDLRAWNQLDLHRSSPGHIMRSLCVSVEGPADEENHVSFNWGKATVDLIAAWQYGQVQTYPFHWTKANNTNTIPIAKA